MNTYSALISYYTRDRYDLLFDVKQKKISIEEFKEDAISFMNDYYPQEENKQLVANQLVENLLGYSVITSLIEDDSISDIKIHDWNKIVIKRKGRREESSVSFKNEEDYNRFIESVITRNQVNASTQNAIQRFTDDDGFDSCILRFTLITPFLTTSGKYKLIIRKVPKDFYSMDDLVREEMMDESIKNYLCEAWNRGSILICGANSSGKTTLLNALKEEIPHDKSVLVIQQAEELTTREHGGHPDMIFLHSIEGTTESDVHYDLKELSIAGLTCDVDYFIIGEVKGAEANYLLNASYTGHTCGATIHSGSSQTALDKLVDYALYTGSYTKPELMAMMTCFKTVVFMEDFKVTEISEVVGKKENEIEYRTMYDRNEGIDNIG